MSRLHPFALARAELPRECASAELGRLGRVDDRWLLTIVCLLSFAFLAVRLHHGFLPYDDPVLGHMAERALQGELPNADFHDDYTGGLTFLNAFAFKLVGVHLLAPRLILFAFFMLWVPTLWWVARRISSPLTASLVTLLAVAWSVPLYPSPLPSWYNLYFATFGTAALLRYLDGHRARWVFIAGILGGMSFLAKISGLYFLAAAGLFLIFDEQSVQEAVQFRERNVSDSVLSVIVTLVLVGLDILLLQLVSAHQNLTELYHFVAPGTALTFLLMVREWREPRFPSYIRVWQLAIRVVPLTLGALLPIALFLIPYARHRELTKWLVGVFILPLSRMHVAFYPAINAVAALCCLPLFLVLLLNSELRGRRSRVIALITISVAMVLLSVAVLRHPLVARWTWVSAGTAIPLITFAGVFVLLHGAVKGSDAARLVLLLSVTALCSLVQFPFSGLVCFCFVAPLAILTFTELSRTSHLRAPISLLTPIALFYGIFLLAIVMPSQIFGRVTVSVSAPLLSRETLTALQACNISVPTDRSGIMHE